MKKTQSYYEGALDALEKVDKYLEKAHASARSPIRKLLLNDIGLVVDCISTEFAVDNAKRRGDWPTEKKA